MTDADLARWEQYAERDVDHVVLALIAEVRRLRANEEHACQHGTTCVRDGVIPTT